MWHVLFEDLGYETKILEDEERVLLLEKNAAATAVAEITPSEISNKIIEYNHFLLKGNIEEKWKILLVLADKFEPVKNELKKVDAILEDPQKKVPMQRQKTWQVQVATCFLSKPYRNIPLHTSRFWILHMRKKQQKG